MSSQISDDNLQDNFKLAEPHQASGFQPDQTSKEVLHFLAKVMKTIEWPKTLCPLKTSPCKKPTTGQLPDVVICVLWGTIHPQEMPIFICEIIGSKDIWGKGSMEYKGWVATLKNLCFLPVTYYLEVRDIAAHLYQIQCKPKSGIIDPQYTEFNFQKDPAEFQAVMVDLSKAIVKGLMELLQYIDISFKSFLDYDKSGKNVTLNLKLNIGQNSLVRNMLQHSFLAEIAKSQRLRQRLFRF